MRLDALSQGSDCVAVRLGLRSSGSLQPRLSGAFFFGQVCLH